MNEVVLIGRLTRDPDVKMTTGESPLAVARFTIAIDDGYGEKKKTNFPSIVAFGKTAESCEKFLSKGKLVAVHGKLQTGSYKNKEDVTVYTTDVAADKVEFLEWGEKTPNEDGTPVAKTGKAAPAAPVVENEEDDDIRF